MPLALSVGGWSILNRELRVLVGFAVFLLGIFMTAGYVREVRTEMPVLLLLLPPALVALEAILHDSRRPA